MRHNTKDKTLERNYLEKYRFLIKEYQQIKAGTHPKFRFAQDFYKAHDTDRRSFLKYYNRYKQSGSEADLLPQKRGPRYKTRRPLEDMRMIARSRVTELKDLRKSYSPNREFVIGNLTPSECYPSNSLELFVSFSFKRKRKEESNCLQCKGTN